MKFAVKTRTCLGCKTALKPTNSVPGREDPSQAAIVGKELTVQLRWRCLSQLSKAITRAVSQTDKVICGASDAVRKAMDAMSALPGIPSSGRYFTGRFLHSAFVPALISGILPVSGCVVYE